MIELKGNNTQYSGGKAELIFAHWCREVQATPTKTDFDEVGVDFTVTFPSRTRTVVALDLHKPEMVCLVQVKGSEDLTDSVNMTYGKLQLLISHPLPAFIVLINYDKSRSEEILEDGSPPNYANWPVRAYVMPLDEERITEILRQLREAETDIFSKYKSIRARPEEEIRTNGHSLRDAIRGHIGDYMQYVRQKTVAWERTGYGEDAYLVTVNVTVTPEQLADFAIGLPMPVNLTSVQDNRFQIPRELPIRESTAFAKISEVPPSAEGVKLIFVSEDKALSAEFLCDMYHPLTMFPDLEDAAYRIRLKNEYADFYLNPAQKTVAANFNLGEPAPLALLRGISHVLHMFDGGQFTMILEHGGSRSEDIVNSASAAPTLPVGAQWLHFGIAAAHRISEELGQEIGLVSLGDLMNQFDRLHKFCSLLIDRKPGFSANASPEVIADLAGKEVAVVLPCGATIGGYFFAGAFVVHGVISASAQPENGWFTIPARCELVHSIVRPRPAGSDEPPAKPLVERARAWVNERGMRLLQPGEGIKLKIQPVADV